MKLQHLETLASRSGARFHLLALGVLLAGTAPALSAPLAGALEPAPPLVESKARGFTCPNGATSRRYPPKKNKECTTVTLKPKSNCDTRYNIEIFDSAQKKVATVVVKDGVPKNPAFIVPAKGFWTIVDVDPEGAKHTVSGTYTTGKASVPTASFTQSISDLTVTFANTSTGTIDSHAWDFGDGNTSSAKSPTHTYEKAGTYMVTLVETNLCGTSVTTMTIDVCT